MRIFGFLAIVSVLGLSSFSAQAFEGYPADLTNQFVSWCSTSQNQSQTVCSCAVNQAAVQIPAASLAFGDFSMHSTPTQASGSGASTRSPARANRATIRGRAIPGSEAAHRRG